jgi:hypothetical protein
MMTKKMITVSLLALGICTTAMALEYKEPEVKFQKHSAPSKEMKVSDFGDHYKVEKAVNENDRQIASEDEVKFGEAEKPQPWRFRTEERSDR